MERQPVVLRSTQIHESMVGLGKYKGGLCHLRAMPFQDMTLSQKMSRCRSAQTPFVMVRLCPESKQPMVTTMS